jgi:hypothetical protein
VRTTSPEVLEPFGEALLERLVHLAPLDRSVEEEIGGDEAPLHRIHGQSELFKRRETQQDGIPGLSEDHPAGYRVPIHCHHGLTDISLGPPAVGQHEGNPPEPLHPEPVKEFSRHHGHSSSGVRERGR